MQYVWLAIAWVVYGLLHSVLAAIAVKQHAQAILKNNYRYYRLGYSLFATITLVLVVWFHFSIKAALLWQNTIIEKVIAAILATPALIIMAISIKKYFMDLSGVEVFFKNRSINPPRLEQTGLHKYVRHPLYFGTLLFVWCIFLWQPSVSNLVSCICITLYTIFGTYYEEKKLVQQFGDEYISYKKKVPMLAPALRAR